MNEKKHIQASHSMLKAEQLIALIKDDPLPEGHYWVIILRVWFELIILAPLRRA